MKHAEVSKWIRLMEACDKLGITANMAAGAINTVYPDRVGSEPAQPSEGEFREEG